MAVVHEVVQGWTGRLTFQLSTDGTALDGTGLTVSDVILTAGDDTAVDTSGDFGWATQASGIVYYDPDASDFVAAKGPYRVRIKITDGSGKAVYFPNGAPDEIVVHP